MKLFVGVFLAITLSFTGCAVLEKVFEDFKEEATAEIDPVTGEVLVKEGTFDYDALLSAVFGVGKILVPGLAAFELGLSLISRRKRRHYIDVVKSLIPANGKVELIPAAVSFVRALGAAHSSPETKDVYEKVEELAKKKKA